MERSSAGAKTSWTMRVLWGVNVVFLAICVILAVAALAPGMPFLGLFGSATVPTYAPWFIILPVFLEAAVLFRSGATRRRVAQALFAAALFVSTVSSIVLIRMIHTAHISGVRIDALDLFRLQLVKSGRKADEIVPYASDEHGALMMAVYKPKRATNGLPAPILIDLHGGGWISGTMTDHDRDTRWFVDHGWLVFSPEYTLSGPDLHMWDRTIGQVGCAMAWIGTNGGNFNGDTSGVSLFGDSAGGNLALNAAYMANAGSLKSECSGAVPHVGAVIAAYPVVDPAAFYKNTDALLGGVARTMATDYIGGSPFQYPERYSFVSSGTYLTPNAPPTLILVGEADHLVPPYTTYNFVDRAQRYGVDAQLIRVPYGEHVFNGAFGSVGNQIVRKATLQFLREHSAGMGSLPQR